MRHLKAWLAGVLLLPVWSGAFAFALKQDKGRFEDLSIHDPSLVTDHASRGIDSLPPGNGLRAGWDRFSSRFQASRGSWRVQIDARGVLVSDSVTLDVVRRAALFLRELAASGPVGSAAIVTDIESTFGVIRQLSMLAGDACRLEPFREPDQARLWLGWDR